MVGVGCLDGGQPVRLTTTPSDEFIPAWSHDGEWIYFSSGREIWKVPSRGGQAVQVTKAGGRSAAESADGKYLYYTKRTELWRMPTTGGSEEQVLPSVLADHFALAGRGVYFNSSANGMERAIQYFSFSDHKIKTVAAVGTLAGGHSALSPDGKFLVYSQIDSLGSDLALVENFR